MEKLKTDLRQIISSYKQKKYSHDIIKIKE